MEEKDEAFTLPGQARRAEKRKSRQRLIRRLAIVGLCVLAAVLVGVIAYIHYRLTHVQTFRATVLASIVEISPHVDARMAAVLVRPGEHVEVDQPLARLDDSELRADLAAAEAERAIRANLHEQAVARAEETAAEVGAEVKLAEARVRIAEADLARARAALALRKAQLPEQVKRAEATRDEAAAELASIKEGTRKEEVEAARARLASAKALADLYQLELQQSEDLSRDGIDSPHMVNIRRTRLTSQQNAVRESELELARLVAGPTKDEIERVHQRLVAREAELALVRAGASDVEAAAADVASRDAELARAQADLERTRALKSRTTVAELQVAAARAELEKADATLEGRKAALAQMTLTSPVTGAVLVTRTHEGEIARKGEPAILVIDDTRGRWVEAFVAEKDADYVREGQTASIELVTGETVPATVVAKGQSTYALTRRGGGDDASSYRFGEMVWVKIEPNPKDFVPIYGSSARAVISIR